MANICDCYKSVERKIPCYDPTTGYYLGSYTGIGGYCLGTKECDLCSCGGDESKCNFYPEKRERKEKKIDRIEVKYAILEAKNSMLRDKLASAEKLISTMLENNEEAARWLRDWQSMSGRLSDTQDTERGGWVD